MTSMESAENVNCFTFTWEIGNYFLLQEGRDNWLRSPIWKTENSKDSAWWRLRPYFEESDISFNLFRFLGSWVFDRCELSLVASDGEVPLKEIRQWAFSILKSSIFDDNGKMILPGDTLIIRCRMFEKTMLVGECNIRSSLHRVNYAWKKDFIPADHNYIFIEKDNLHLCLSLKCTSEKGTVAVIVSAMPNIGSFVSFVGCKVIIQDGIGRTVNQECLCPFVSWRCDIENFAGNNENSCPRFELESIVAAHKNSTPLDSTGTLGDDLLSIFRDKILSDATLTSEGESFSAHRSVLAARSPVFRAMFLKDELREGQSGLVDIDDIDSETLDRMLVFIYSDRLGDLQWNQASKLYYAADKYAVLPLKRKCFDILKAGMTVSNACDALVLADRHSDNELMKCTLDFILNHDEVISSTHWEELEASNLCLAAKVAKELFLKRGNK